MRSRSVWLGIALVALLSICFPVVGSASERAAARIQYVSDEVLVRLSPSVDAQAFARASRLRDNLAATDRLGKDPIYRFKIADGDTPPSKVLKLLRNPQVLYAEPNYLGQLPEARQRSSWVVGGDDNQYWNQWAPAKMHLPEAHAITEGAGVTVAILDTGVDTQHPQLRKQLVAGYDFVGLDADPSEEGAYGVDAAYGHGTHVAGLVALAAPQARIMPLRTLNSAGFGTIWSQVQALRYAADHGAKVINLSYSFALPSLVMADLLSRLTCARGADAVCRAATQPGVVVVAAAGNSGLASPEYPAGSNAPGLVAVGATTSADTIASFSNYGSWVQVGAPGDHILSTIPGGGFASWSGTSMASPLAAGTIALVRSRFPQLRPSEAAVQVKTTAVSLPFKIRRRVDAVKALTLVVR